MKSILTTSKAVQKAVDDLDRPDFVNKKQYAVYRDAISQGLDAALYIGPTIELKVYDFENHEVAELDFLTAIEAFAWRKDNQPRLPSEILAAARKHGYKIYTNFNRMPKKLQSILTDS